MSMDHWCTPPDVCRALEDFFDGPVDVDPCSNARSIVSAKKAYTAGGLHLPWGRTSFINRPYSRMDIWTDKIIYELVMGRLREAVSLDPVATSTAWWRRQSGVEPVIVKRGGVELSAGGGEVKPIVERITAPAAVHLFARRIGFINDQGVVVDSPRHDPVFTYFGPRKAAFRKAFKAFESWTVTP